MIRIVLPNLEKFVEDYVQSLQELVSSESDETRKSQHKQAMRDLFEQTVHKEPVMRKYRRAIVVFLERRIIGDGRQTGEAYRWMYDHF